MKRSIFFLLVALTIASFAGAQVVVSDGFDQLRLHYVTPTLSLESRALDGAKAQQIVAQEYIPGGEVGFPALPLKCDMLVVPFCQSIEVVVTNAHYDTLDMGIDYVWPLQPSRSKSDTAYRAPVINTACYATSAFYGLPLASVEVSGIARDRRLATIRFSPAQVNPVTGQVVVCRSADITVRYIGSDEDATREHFRRYHTPAFSVGATLNSLMYAKDVTFSAPLRMVIVAPETLRCQSLEHFAEWKRTQGMLVDILYTNGESNSIIADSLKSFYTHATVDAPAPTYLLLVGDHAQTRAFNSRISSYYMSDHITDLYYVTWTDRDNLPDCYWGRFSATDTSTVERIVTKTLLSEQYAFENDDYLARAALISGEDNGTHQTSGWMADNAWIHCDPTMDYIAKTYINHRHGYDTVSYYKNNVNFAPDSVYVTGYCSNASAAEELRELYSEGLGWINYSAHGDWDKWHKPTFTTSHISSMSNNGKPSFMIGNCCLTNKFDKDVCFGEALLRRGEGAGAIGYIGGTNSTLWEEDFYWSVGVRSNIQNTMNTDYNANKLGMYDCLFHTHNESIEKYAITAGAMVVSGNMAVNASSSSYKLYYWEIYELMGDPSLLPWLGRAADVQVAVARNNNDIVVTTIPYAYVAIVDSSSNNLHAAVFADANGVATFDIDRSTDLSRAFLSVTAQGYKPYQRGLNELIVGISNVQTCQPVNVYPNPATDHVTISADGLTEVDLLDPAGRMLYTSRRSPWVVDLSACRTGVYFLRLHSAAGVTVKKIIKK